MLGDRVSVIERKTMRLLLNSPFHGRMSNFYSTFDAPTRAIVLDVMSISRITSSLFWNGMVQKASDTGRFQSIVACSLICKTNLIIQKMCYDVTGT
jgi:hypothetical protein